MQSKGPLYLDYAATTPVDPRVVEAMLPYSTEYFGNPASQHTHGEYAKRAVNKAKEQIATLVNADYLCKSNQVQSLDWQQFGILGL